MIEIIAALTIGIFLGIILAVGNPHTVIVKGDSKKVVEYGGKIYRLELDE